ncbi:SurA N-terminal domain-containing protein [Actinotalea sp. BY-33]|uniref:SurA N-terminal domain-containing protein n=1 Tax=Actinotalea soli TaxID=2819234 RepID=A0A939LMF2_9CELL|nr:SurA N-terminal domain-containing protein [Actinotalea soli]MBO1750507.1 SurA N-terminal domain-containing protein [Actinotalea soli]
MTRTTRLGAGLAITLLAVAGCSATDEGDPGETTSQETAAPDEAPDTDALEPDLEGIPEVVAQVDGHEISRDEFVEAYQGQFQQLALQAQSTGQPVDQEQLRLEVADTLVGTQLLIQEAEARGFEATDTQVDETLAELAEVNGLGSADEVVEALAAQGLSEDEVRSELRTQVKVDQLVDDAVGDTTPTDAEVQELYDGLVEQQEAAGGEAEVPPLDDVRPQLEEQLTSTARSEAIGALLTELRESAEVTINL